MCDIMLGGVKWRCGMYNDSGRKDHTKSGKTDLHLTSTLQSAAQLLGIKLLDHIILGSYDSEDGQGFVSIEEIG